MKRVLVIGSGGHAKVVLDILEGQYEIVGLIDDRRRGDALGYPILGGNDRVKILYAQDRFDEAFVAIGDNWTRYRVRCFFPEIPLATAIHPNATVSRSACIASGTVVMAQAVVNPSCRIEEGAIVNTASSLDHDSTMGRYSSLAPGVRTGGNCTIGEFSAIGIGAVLKHGLCIGDHVVIGASSTVLHDIPPLSVAYGTPARVIRQRKEGDPYL